MFGQERKKGTEKNALWRKETKADDKYRKKKKKKDK